MARNKEFDKDKALAAAIGVFREHGFEGTSTNMLVRAMGIGRQSLYDTYGDKWRLYCHAVERYSDMETKAHIEMLLGQPRAVDGLRAMIDRVVAQAGMALDLRVRPNAARTCRPAPGRRAPPDGRGRGANSGRTG